MEIEQGGRYVQCHLPAEWHKRLKDVAYRRQLPVHMIARKAIITYLKNLTQEKEENGKA